MDRKQVSETFVKETNALYRFALRMTRSPQDTEEAVARTALRALEKADHFKEQSSVRTWLFGILINVVREMRKENWREELIDDQPYPPDSDFNSAGQRVESLPGLGDNPEETLLRAESTGQIRAQIDLLPPLQRSAFHLRFIEQWDSVDICNALEITDTHLRVLLHRARLRLRERLVEYLKGRTT